MGRTTIRMNLRVTSALLKRFDFWFLAANLSSILVAGMSLNLLLPNYSLFQQNFKHFILFLSLCVRMCSILYECAPSFVFHFNGFDWVFHCNVGCSTSIYSCKNDVSICCWSSVLYIAGSLYLLYTSM